MRTGAALKLRRSRRSNSRCRRAAPLHVCLRLEQLEQRQLLAVVNWTGLGDAVSWEDPANWDSSPALPALADDVVIDQAGANVVHSIGSDVVNSITSVNPLTISGGTLSIVGAITADNPNGHSALTDALTRHLGALEHLSHDQLLAQRADKFLKMGKFEEA